MPKQLGYVWETGTPKDHIWVDDGLRPPFLVPSFLCSSRQVSHRLWNENNSKINSISLISSNTLGVIQKSFLELLKLANITMNYLTGMKAIFLMNLIGILLSGLAMELSFLSLWELGMAFRRNAVPDAENEGI